MNTVLRSLMGVRDDLQLSDRWWHRLGQILLILTTAVVAVLTAWIAHAALTPEAHQRNFNFTTLQEYRAAQPKSATRIVDNFIALPGRLGRLNDEGRAERLWELDLKRGLFCSQDVFAHLVELVEWEKANGEADPAPTIESVTAELEAEKLKPGDPACVFLKSANIPETSRAVKWQFRPAVVWTWRLKTAAVTLAMVFGWVLLSVNFYYRGVIYVAFGNRKRGSTGRVPTLPGGVPFTNANRPKALNESIATLHWIHAKLHGMKIAALPESKRAQLAGACWHIAVEHSMAIVLLVDDGVHGSSLALVRPLFESYIRGMWLMHAATDAEVDAAGRDDFPRDINKLTRALEAAGASHFTVLKEQWWKRLCSLTHTGYQQIGARLTPEGLGYAYDNDEIAQALGWADGIGVLAVVAFAEMAQDESLALEALNYMRKGAGEFER